MEVMVICDELGQAVSAKGGIPRINSVILRVEKRVVEIQSAGRLHLGVKEVRAE